ncbi:unnamed protein product, partial [Prorocentrum cordatum]
ETFVASRWAELQRSPNRKLCQVFQRLVHLLSCVRNEAEGRRGLHCLQLFGAANGGHQVVHKLCDIGLGAFAFGEMSPTSQVRFREGMRLVFRRAMHLLPRGALWVTMNGATWSVHRRSDTGRVDRYPRGSEDIKSVFQANATATHVSIIALLCWLRGSEVCICIQPGTLFWKFDPIDQLTQ